MVNARNCVQNGNGSTPLKKAKRLLSSHITPLMAAVALYYAREAYIMASKVGTCETGGSTDRTMAGFWRVLGFIIAVSVTFVMTAYVISMGYEEKVTPLHTRKVSGATQTVSGALSMDSDAVKSCRREEQRAKKSPAKGHARFDTGHEDSSPTPPVATRRIELSERNAQAARVHVRDVQRGTKRIKQQESQAQSGSTASKKMSEGKILAAKNSSMLKNTMKPVAGVVARGVDAAVHQHATSETVPQKRHEACTISKEEVQLPRAMGLSSSNLQGGEFSQKSTRSSNIKAAGGGYVSGTSASRPSTAVESATCQGCIMCDMMERYDYTKLLSSRSDENASMYQVYLSLWQQAHSL